MGNQPSKAKKRDALLRTMLRTPPEPHDPKPKKHQSVERQLKEMGELIGQDDPNWTKDGWPKRA